MISSASEQEDSFKDVSSPSGSYNIPAPDLSQDPDPDNKKQKVRWSKKICFICKLRLGSNHSLRIGKDMLIKTIRNERMLLQLAR